MFLRNELIFLFWCYWACGRNKGKLTFGSLSGKSSKCTKKLCFWDMQVLGFQTCFEIGSNIVRILYPDLDIHQISDEHLWVTLDKPITKRSPPPSSNQPKMFNPPSRAPWVRIRTFQAKVQ